MRILALQGGTVPPRKLAAAVFGITFLTSIASMAGAQPAREIPSSAVNLLAKAGPMFIENQGQFDPAVRFRASAGGATLWLTDDGMRLTLREPSPLGRPESTAGPAAGTARELRLKISFDGAHTGRLEPFGRIQTQVSFLIGNDASRWRTGVPVWSGVRYVNVYQGVDLEVSAPMGKLAWRWVLAGPAAITPPASALRVEGGETIALERNGLRIGSELGEVQVLHPPAVTTNGTLLGSTAQSAQPAIVLPPPIAPPPLDPTPFLPIFYSSFLGGGSTDAINGLAVDALNRVYVTGLTSSTNFPVTAGVLKTTFSGGDAFVAKVNTNGTLAYATYLGGTSSDSGQAITVDNHDFSVWVTGTTNSTDFPIPVSSLGTIQKTNAGGGDAFLAKINPTGTSLLFATYFGGESGDFPVAIRLDSGGLVYFAGTTSSASFPTSANAFQKTDPGFSNGFVAKIDPVNNIVIFSTYFGGGGNSQINDMDIDSGGVYLTGATTSATFPTSTGAVQPTRGGGDDAFVSKLTLTGSSLIYSTYLGTATFGEHGRGIAVDALGQATVVGDTASPNFPVTAGVFGQSLKGSSDGFVTKLNATGSGFVFSTLLGGSGGDLAQSVKLDSSGNIYVAGNTASTDFPATPDAFQLHSQGVQNTFFALIKNNGTTLSYATYFAGNQNDSVSGLAVSPAGVFLAGNADTGPTGTTAAFPLVHPFQSSFAGGGQDGFLAMFHIPGPGSITGLVFIDGNRNGVKDSSEGGVGSVFVDANGAQTVTSNANGTYTLSNLQWGSYTVCVSPLAVFTSTTPSCQSVLLAPSDVVPNVNFGIAARQFTVGVGDLKPASATVRPGQHLNYAFQWTHPQNWHLLDEIHLRFLDEFDQTILWIRFEEGSNTFAVYNADIGDFGPPVTPGSAGTVETPFATLYLSDSTFVGSGPTGPSVMLNYDVSFKATAANRTYRVLMMATDDAGVQEGFEPAGLVTVGETPLVRRIPER
jgi:hypothetical protein